MHRGSGGLAKKDKYLVGLDIGSTKTSVLIAEVDGELVKFLALGAAESKGLRKGLIVNLDSTVSSIRRAVEEAESVANVPVEEALIGVAGGHVRGVNSRGGITLGQRPPRLLTPRTWPPATPISASSTGTLATPSASSTARRMELTVASRLTMRPLRNPLDSAAPRARNFTRSPSISAIKTQVFVLPMSSPIRYLSFFAKPPLPR